MLISIKLKQLRFTVLLFGQVTKIFSLLYLVIFQSQIWSFFLVILTSLEEVFSLKMKLDFILGLTVLFKCQAKVQFRVCEKRTRSKCRIHSANFNIYHSFASSVNEQSLTLLISHQMQSTKLSLFLFNSQLGGSKQ